MKKIIVALWASICIRGGSLWAFTVRIPDITRTSATDGGDGALSMGVVNADPDSYLSVIAVANNYLWFALAAVCAGVLVYIGIQLMSAQGDKAKMQQANKALIGLLIGLMIAFFSYAIIRIVANWF